MQRFTFEMASDIPAKAGIQDQFRPMTSAFQSSLGSRFRGNDKTLAGRKALGCLLTCWSLCSL